MDEDILSRIINYFSGYDVVQLTMVSKTTNFINKESIN
jgi:hypothetical protein